MEVSAVTENPNDAAMALPDAEYKPFLPSKTGNWFGYSEENHYVPPALKSKTVASCLDYYYWRRHENFGNPIPVISAILYLFSGDMAHLVAFDKFHDRPL